MDSFLSIMALVLWAIPPLGAFTIYFRLAWWRNRPLPVTARNLLSYVAAMLVVAVVFFGAAFLFVALFHTRSFSDYLGLSFPKPPGLFAAIGATCAIAAALFAVHALALAVWRRGRG